MKVFFTSSTHLGATIDGLFVAAFVGRPSDAIVRAHEEAPAPRAYIQIARLTGRMGSSPDELRRSYQRLAQRHAADLHTAALVLHDAGFGAAMLRGVVTSIGLVVPGLRMRAFVDLGDALGWMGEERGAPLPEPTERHIRELLRREGHALAW